MENGFINYLIYLALTAYPTWRIIKRTGLNANWTALVLIPGFGFFIILIMLAFSKWPLNTKGDA
jgi:hypothetical protein